MGFNVFGLAKNDQHAAKIVRALNANGYLDSDISILTADQSGAHDLAHENTTKAPEGAATGAGSGAAIGGALGWIVGIGALAIPGVGPFIAAGPILAALSGAAIGGAMGGVTGALIGLGIPEYEAKQYEGKLKEGNVLLSVHCASSESSKRAAELLKAQKAESVSSATEAAVKP